MSKNDTEIGFLGRKPLKINSSELYDGGFLLPIDTRNKILEDAENNKKGISPQIFKVKGGHKNPKEFEVYISSNQEAYVKGPLLGEGAFGEVFIMQNIATGQWFCMKQIKKDKKLKESELDILKQEGLFRSSDKIDDQSLLISELIHGEDLSDIIKQNKKDQKLTFEQALALGISLVEAYDSLQRRGFVHRDIKAANVMVDMSQLKCTAIDFGSTVSKHADTRNTFTGSPSHMSLEYVETNQATLGTDMYSIGITISEIFASMSDLDTKKVVLPEDRQKLLDRIEKAFQEKKLDNLSKAAQNSQRAIAHVILGAVSKEYQEEELLEKEEIKLFKVLYNLTGEYETRPSLNETLFLLKEIRLEHLQKRGSKLPAETKSIFDKILNTRKSMDEQNKKTREEYLKTKTEYYKVKSEYSTMLELEKIKPVSRFGQETKEDTIDDLTRKKKALAKLEAQKNSLEERLQNPLIDDLDAFMLTMVDLNVQNRPNAEKAQQYLDAILTTQKNKEKIHVDIKSGKKLNVYKMTNEESILNLLHEQNKQLTKKLNYLQDPDKQKAGKDHHAQYYRIIKEESPKVIDNIRHFQQKLFGVEDKAFTIDKKNWLTRKNHRAEVVQRIDKVIAEIREMNTAIYTEMKNKMHDKQKITKLINHHHSKLQELISLGEVIHEKPITRYFSAHPEFVKTREECLRNISESLKETGLETAALYEPHLKKTRKVIQKKTMTFDKSREVSVMPEKTQPKEPEPTPTSVSTIKHHKT